MWEIEDALLAGRIWDVRAEISKCLVELQALPGMHTEDVKPSRMLWMLAKLERDDQRHNAAAIGKVAVVESQFDIPRFAPQASSHT